MAASTDDVFRQGMSFFTAGNLREAEKSFRKIARRGPAHPVVLGVLGAVLTGLGKYDEAEQHLRAALKLDPKSHAALYNHGLALKALHRPDEALVQFNQALAINPDDAETLNNRGTVLNDLKNFEAAIKDFDKALLLNPAYAVAFFNKGNSLAGLARYDDAIAAYQRALSLKQDLAEGWYSLGYALHKQRRHAEAIIAYGAALQLKPDYPFLKGILLHQKMLVCDWQNFDSLSAAIEQDIAAGKLSAEPFGWQGIATSNRSLQRCAEIYNQVKFPPVRNTPRARPDNGGIIRIGYVSGEFREQATLLLLAGVLDQHDTSRFEIHAFDNGWDDGGELRKRFEKAVHHCHSIRELDDAQAAKVIRDSGIDILVNLNGYFGEDRTNVFAQRPAPIQVNYLGFPGTMGAPYMDYIVADATVIPASERKFFTEKVVTLPECYQANDRARFSGDATVSRADCGLPETATVFCCFNNSYKITPETFASWLRILQRVPGSVLWLLAESDTAKENLRKAAAAQGVAPERVIFAERAALAEHLARHRCADLFLDTLPYNAHTTASDALWAGLPVLTCTGETFAGRVATSLLQNIGLPDLVTSSRDEYENRAVELASQPEKLAALRQKLDDNRLTTPLFDTARFTRKLERAYIAMQQHRATGQKPDHITLEND